MTLIKVNNRYINLDNVIKAESGDLAGKVILTTTDGANLYFHDDEAIALRSWLDGRASDVLRLYELEQAQVKS